MELPAVTLHPSGVVVDLVGRRVRRPDGAAELTEREASLFAYLAARPGEIVARGELLQEVWRVRPTTRTRALDMCVRRLREHLELDPEEPRHLLTVRGAGYRFVPRASTHEAPIGRGGNVAADRGPLVGREAELARLTELVGQGLRLVTVVGPAGVGKSRLVREWARRSPRPGGVWFVDLGEEATTEGMLRAIDRVLGLDGGGELSAERLGAVLAARGSLVLVPDAAEGCAEVLASLVRTLLERAPDLTLVVTSRRPLHARDEVVLRVEPLPAADALALLRQRVDGPLPEQADRLVVRLEGLPLAVELAAARLRVFTCAELVERLQAGSDVLRDGGTGRHASLQRALLDSWRTLDPEDQRVLGQLAVFRGGFTLHAARAVLDRPDAADRVQSLLEQSLLRSEHVANPGLPRFRLFDCVRQLAEERADPAQTERAYERHARYFLGAIERLWPPALVLGDEDRWIGDTANLVVAVERGVTRWPDLATGGLLRLRWHLVGGIDAPTLRRLAAELAAVAAPRDRVLVLLVMADTLQLGAHPAEAESAWREVLALARQSAPSLVAPIRQALANFLSTEPGSREEALALSDDALREARAEGDPRTLAYVLRRRAELRASAEAEEHFAEALALYRQLGDPLGELVSEVMLGREAGLRGVPTADRLVQACARWTARSRQAVPNLVLQAVAIALYLEDRSMEARAWALDYLDRVQLQARLYLVPFALELCGAVELDLGHLAAARIAFEKVLRRVGSWPPSHAGRLQASSHLHLGLVAHAEGDLVQARGHYRLVARDDEQAAVAAGLWALAGGGEEARAWLEERRARADPLVAVGEALADLHAGGARRLEDARPTGWQSSAELTGARVGRTAARLLAP